MFETKKTDVTVKKDKTAFAKAAFSVFCERKAFAASVLSTEGTSKGFFAAGSAKSGSFTFTVAGCAKRWTIKMNDWHTLYRFKSTVLNRLCTVFFCLFFIPVTLTGEEPSSADFPRSEQVMIEDFEKEGSQWKLSYRTTITGSVYGLSRLESLLQRPGSQNRYMLITYSGPGAHPVRISPSQPVFMKGFVHCVQFELYGRNRPDQVFLHLEDIEGNRIRTGGESLQFAGWKTVSIDLPGTLKRRPVQPHLQAGLILTGLEIRSGSRKVSSMEYEIDDIRYLARPYFKVPELRL